MNHSCSTERHTGFELLRILSMLMIVLMHAIGHGGLGATAANGTFSYFVYWFLFLLGRVSTNCFVMLTGYYMVTSQTKISRLFRIEVQTLFYSLLTFGISIAFQNRSFSLNGLIQAITPISSYIYWFISCYFMLYLAIPLLNKIILNLTQGQHRLVLCGLFIVLSLWSTLCFWSQTTAVKGGYSYIWFFALYFLSSYIRLYQITWHSRNCLLLYFGCCLFAIFSRMNGLALETRFHLTGFIDILGGYQAPPSLFASIALFLLFQNIHVDSPTLKKFILKIAPLSLGVYLLHDSDFSRELLWQIIDLPRFGSLLPCLGYMLVSIFLIAVTGYLVDNLYHKLYRFIGFPKLELKIDALVSRLTSMIEYTTKF